MDKRLFRLIVVGAEKEYIATFLSRQISKGTGQRILSGSSRICSHLSHGAHSARNSRTDSFASWNFAA